MKNGFFYNVTVQRKLQSCKNYNQLTHEYATNGALNARSNIVPAKIIARKCGLCSYDN